MKRSALRIVSLSKPRVKDCAEIARSSEPWKTLGEGIDFSGAMARREAFVCIRDNKTAGFVIFNPAPVFGRGGYLRAIGVSPALLRSGIGSALLDFAEERTSRKSANLYLCVSSFNRPAQRFYRSRGYLRVGTIPGLILPNASEYIYRKQLRPGATQSR